MNRYAYIPDKKLGELKVHSNKNEPKVFNKKQRQQNKPLNNRKGEK